MDVVNVKVDISRGNFNGGYLQTPPPHTAAQSSRKSTRERERDTERGRERVCVCEREREAMDKGVLKTMSALLTAEIHPALLGEALDAARTKLDYLVLKWQPAWNGALLSYSDEKLVRNEGLVLPFLPYVQLDISATFLVFAPTVGSTLVGKVHKVGSDYVGMLVLGVFNAVLPAKNIDKKYLGSLRMKGKGATAEKKKRRTEQAEGDVEDIEEGCLLRFRVQTLNLEGGLLTIVGSMKGKGEGVYTPLVQA